MLTCLGVSMNKMGVGVVDCLLLRVLLIAAVFAAAGASQQPPAAPQYLYNCDGDTSQTFGLIDACLNMTDTLADARQRNRAAPAIAAAVATAGANAQGRAAITYVSTVGQFTYEANSAIVTDSTLFDMASCSKIMGTTTAVAQMYQAGYLSLDDPVTKFLGAGFAANGKAAINIANLLVHNSGFPPDPTPYWYSDAAFGCPQTANFHPSQDFTCEDKVLAAVLNQTLQYATNTASVYSDLSFITLMFVVGNISRTRQLVPPAQFPPVCQGLENSSLICNFYAYVKVNVLQRLNLTSTDYLPTSPLMTPPAWPDNVYHHGLIMGYVSDSNAYAMGGVSGHAGLFSNVRDSLAVSSRLGERGGGGPLAERDDREALHDSVERVAEFASAGLGHQQSKRAAVWQSFAADVHARGLHGDDDLRGSGQWISDGAADERAVPEREPGRRDSPAAAVQLPGARAVHAVATFDAVPRRR
jgi:CubicO group peptidase (beta-lactamase class C family)